MSQPLLATRMIVLNYTVSGLTHVQRSYVKPGAVIGGVPHIVYRDGATTQDWGVSAQAMWSMILNVLNSGVLAAVAEFKQLIGVNWVPIDIRAMTGVGGLGTATSLASQLTYVLRDTAFKPVRFQIMEPAQGYTGHSNTGYGMGTAVTPITQQIDGSDSSPDIPYQWVVSRGNRYLAATGCVAGVTLDLNDKLKRARNFE